MSKLWTPGGDHTPEGDDDLDDDDEYDVDDLNTLDDEELEARLAAELAQTNAQIAAAPVEDIIVSHLRGLFDLAMIHLHRTAPDFLAAGIAIDAAGAIIDTLGERLGEHAGIAREALAQMRLAFVQVKAAHSRAAGEGTVSAG